MRIKGRTKNKLAKISRNLIKHTSHKEVNKPPPRVSNESKQEVDYFKRGNFKMSIDRKRENSQTRRTIDPSFDPPKMLSAYDNYYHQPPQTVKHLSSKTLSFKPPKVPKELMTGRQRRHDKKNNQSSFKLSYDENELKAHKPPSLSKKKVGYKMTSKPTVYRLGTYERISIKDSSKHAKSHSTSNSIKKIREYQSSLTNLPGSISQRKVDEPELLKYNLKTKDLEMKGTSTKSKKSEKYYRCQNKIKILHKSDVNVVPQNIGDPIPYAGLRRKAQIPTSGSLNRKNFDSQIVFGNEENYSYNRKPSQIDYSNLQRRSSARPKPIQPDAGNQRHRSSSGKGRRPESARNMFGSHFRFE
ncbi:unnamed protein product [Moneuplotes crassus]|uniref:Uncharacterized protein n=1 Tax=Euplotes crassus TaxID=5936 RepID=A0AAD1XB56_EUPCR|nr:unnamed protein product [Moneuplotes crassus]